MGCAGVAPPRPLGEPPGLLSDNFLIRFVLASFLSSSPPPFTLLVEEEGVVITPVTVLPLLKPPAEPPSEAGTKYSAGGVGRASPVSFAIAICLARREADRSRGGALREAERESEFVEEEAEADAERESSGRRGDGEREETALFKRETAAFLVPSCEV